MNIPTTETPHQRSIVSMMMVVLWFHSSVVVAVLNITTATTTTTTRRRDDIPHSVRLFPMSSSYHCQCFFMAFRHFDTFTDTLKRVHQPPRVVIEPGHPRVSLCRVSAIHMRYGVRKQKRCFCVMEGVKLFRKETKKTIDKEIETHSVPNERYVDEFIQFGHFPGPGHDRSRHPRSA